MLGGIKWRRAANLRNGPLEMKRIPRWFAVSLVAVALASSAALLASDARIRLSALPASLISSVPLLAVGVAFLVIQFSAPPRFTDLLKNVLLAATFILWGIVQLMAPGALSKILGDVVVVMYVVDLAWVILAWLYPGKQLQ